MSEVLSRHLPEGTNENYKTHQLGLQIRQTFEPQLLEYEKGALTTGRRQSVTGWYFLRIQEKDPKKRCFHSRRLPTVM